MLTLRLEVAWLAATVTTAGAELTVFDLQRPRSRGRVGDRPGVNVALVHRVDPVHVSLAPLANVPEGQLTDVLLSATDTLVRVVAPVLVTR